MTPENASHIDDFSTGIADDVLQGEMVCTAGLLLQGKPTFCRAKEILDGGRVSLRAVAGTNEFVVDRRELVFADDWAVIAFIRSNCARPEELIAAVRQAKERALDAELMSHLHPNAPHG